MRKKFKMIECVVCRKEIDEDLSLGKCCSMECLLKIEKERMEPLNDIKKEMLITEDSFRKITWLAVVYNINN